MDRLVPDLMRAFADSQAARLRNPSGIRPWQHVLDPLHGYLLLVQHLYEQGTQYADAWNFGPGDVDVRSAGWIADQLAVQWGDDARWETDTGSHFHEARQLKLDCSKSHELLGWRPRLPLALGLEWTAKWYRGYAAGTDLRALTLAQIAQYTDLPE